jgi:hypothetical protein
MLILEKETAKGLFLALAEALGQLPLLECLKIMRSEIRIIVRI